MTALNFKNIPAINTNQLMTVTLPALATALLVVVIADKVATLTWEMLPSPPETNAPVLVDFNNKMVKVNTDSPQNNVYKQIPNWHLFGTVQKNVPKAVVQAPIEPKDVPDTQLRLTLKGVVASPDIMDA